MQPLPQKLLEVVRMGQILWLPPSLCPYPQSPGVPSNGWAFQWLSPAGSQLTREPGKQPRERGGINLRETGQDWHNHYYISVAWKIIMNHFSSAQLEVFTCSVSRTSLLSGIIQLQWTWRKSLHLFSLWSFSSMHLPKLRPGKARKNSVSRGKLLCVCSWAWINRFESMKLLIEKSNHWAANQGTSCFYLFPNLCSGHTEFHIAHFSRERTVYPPV